MTRMTDKRLAEVERYRASEMFYFPYWDELLQALKSERDHIEVLENVLAGKEHEQAVNTNNLLDRIEELEAELEGKTCLTTCPVCGSESAKSSELLANKRIRKLEGLLK